MTVTLEIGPDAESRLREAAARRGQTVAGLLEHVALALPDDRVLRAFLLAPEGDEPFTDEDQAAVDAALSDMAQGLGIPVEQIRQRLNYGPL